MLPLAMMRPSPLRRTFARTRPLAPCTRKLGCCPPGCGGGAAVGQVGIVVSGMFAGAGVAADSAPLSEATAGCELLLDDAETDSSTFALPAPQPESAVATKAGHIPRRRITSAT